MGMARIATVRSLSRDRLPIDQANDVPEATGRPDVPGGFTDQPDIDIEE